MKDNLTQEQLKKLILSGTRNEIKEVLENIHPADILDILHDEEDENIKEILDHLPNDVIGDIIDEEDDEELSYEWLKLFSKYKQRQILSEVPADTITDMIGELEEDQKNEILRLLNEEDKTDVTDLLKYDPDSAGGIMNTDYIDIHARNTVKKTLEFLQTNKEEDTTYYLYVVDKDNVLKGVVSLADIATSPFDTPMMDIINPNVISILYSEDQEEVAKTFSKYGFIMMPVIDEQDHLLGVIDFDDVMDVIEEESTEDINLLGGVSSEERVDSTVLESFKNRNPWLFVNLITAIMAASVVNMFSGTIAKVVILATINPIITGMGGNSGTQALTIVVRGLSLGEIEKGEGFKILRKEFCVGILNGITIGIVVALGSWLFAGNPWFGVVAGLAMFLNLTVSCIAGYFVPVVLNRLHIDPALASSVFVTTFTDMFGFFAFLGLATLFINLLV
jgi:magnesium transporter